MSARRLAAAIGAAPVAYLLRRRMALAKDALVQGQSTPEEIAGMVGYRSASAFGAAFRLRAGCPPSGHAARIAGLDAGPDDRVARL